MNNHRYLLFFMVPIFTSAACAMEQQAVKATSSPKGILKKTAGQSPETTKKSVAEKRIAKNEPAKVKKEPFQQVIKNFDESIIALYRLANQLSEQKKMYQELYAEYQKAGGHRDSLLELNTELTRLLTVKANEVNAQAVTINKLRNELNLAKMSQQNQPISAAKKESKRDGYYSE